MSGDRAGLGAQKLGVGIGRFWEWCEGLWLGMMVLGQVGGSGVGYWSSVWGF